MIWNLLKTHDSTEREEEGDSGTFGSRRRLLFFRNWVRLLFVKGEKERVIPHFRLG
jgi:hypothetical protein